MTADPKIRPRPGRPAPAEASAAREASGFPGRITSPHRFAGVRLTGLLIGLVVLLLASIIVGISIGSVTVPVGTVWSSIVHHFSGGAVTSVQDRIVWEFRTPRVLLAAIVGAGLAVAGTALQAAVRNPLADSYILGVSSGASVGAVAVIVLGSSATAGLGLSAASFVGAMIALLLVLVLGQRGGRISPVRLVLSGVAIAAILSSVTSYLQLLAKPQQLQGVLFWLLGTVAAADWNDLPTAGVAVLASTLYLLALARPMNLLLTGDESAAASARTSPCCAFNSPWSLPCWSARSSPSPAGSASSA